MMEKQLIEKLNTINETLREILLELEKINLRDAIPSPDEIEDAILDVVKSHERSWVASWEIKHMLNWIPGDMIDNAIEVLCTEEKLTHDMRKSDWVRIPKEWIKIS